MSQTEQGMLFSFRLPGSKMRQSAAQMRRQGQAVDALTLVRRAAEQEDTPSAWLALAEELCHTGNWEAAAPLISRALSRDWHQGGWTLMARCMKALGHPAAAIDCAYHQLQEDPWCADADAARVILEETEILREETEPHRTQKLIQRGLSAWQGGNRALGERRIRRALRLTLDKERLLITCAMLCAMEMDFPGAMRYLPRALRLNPTDARTLTALSTLFYQMGKPRIASGFLQKAGLWAETAQEEDSVLTAAWAQDAWETLSNFLQTKLRRQPHRAPLLTARAMLADAEGDEGKAREIRREILAIDPDDHTAALLLAASPDSTERLMNLPGMTPRDALKGELAELRAAAETQPMAELLRPGSRTRRIVDWFLTERFPEGCQYVLTLLDTHGDEAVNAFLKEMAARPFLDMGLRQFALLRLAEMGCRDELLLMTGASFAVVACQKTEPADQLKPWRTFLPLLLQETRRHGQSAEITEFAAAVWACLPREYRLDAACRNGFTWVKAMEILYLRMAGEEEKAAKAAADSPLTLRRISRVLRRIYRCMSDEPLNE